MASCGDGLCQFHTSSGRLSHFQQLIIDQPSKNSFAVLAPPLAPPPAPGSTAVTITDSNVSVETNSWTANHPHLLRPRFLRQFDLGGGLTLVVTISCSHQKQLPTPRHHSPLFLEGLEHRDTGTQAVMGRLQGLSQIGRRLLHGAT